MTQKLLSPKLLIASILLVVLLLSFESGTYAMDITKGDKVVVVDENTTVPSKYKFIAQFNKNKTTITPFGLTGKNTKSSSGTPYLSFNPESDTSLKGKFGVIYSNIGRYGDKEIDLKITVLDWKRYINNNSGKISFQLNNIGENNQGYYYVDQKWEFYESGTNKKVKINGYMTINDLDSRQGIRFDNLTTRAVGSILVDSSTKGFLSYSNTNGELSIFEGNGILSESNDLHAMVTVLYDELDTIRFKWERDFDKTSINVNKVYDAYVPDGEYFGYIAKKPARSEMLDPSKKIESNGTESETMNISSNKTFNFNLYHSVPDEWSEFYYDNYSITDTIDNRLAIQSIKVVNEEDKDVTSYFDNKTNGNSINLVAKPSNIKSSSFYNNTYKVVVTVKVKNSSDLANAVKNGRVSFNNVFTITTNSKSKKSNQVTANLNQRKIDVWHLDKIDQSTLEHISGNLFDGDSYAYSTKENFKKGDYGYTAVPKETKKGTIDGENVELKFYYLLPLIDVNMKHFQIYTGDANEGLPVKVNLTRVFPYGTSISELANKKLKIALYEQNSNNALISKEYPLKDVPTSIDDWIIPKNNLVKDTHKNYVVKISEVDNKDIVSSNPDINTDGYTSSEKSFKVDAANNSKIFYKGVVMTEREIKEDMEVHYETLTIPLEKLSKQKTGYGFELKTEVTYENDLAAIFNIKVESLVDKRLIDSYLSYQQQDNYNIVPLEQTNKTISTDKKSTNYIFELPHVNVEQKTGYLFSDNQVAAKDSHITYKLKDGMRKLYTPIWSDLGNYNVSLQSIEPIGVNKVTFQVNDKLNLYAYMFGTIGSETLEDDEILIEPVDPKDPFPEGLPNGWTKNDLEWFKK
ncbi:isopeptide-forming domain-containing fimbrial protein [Peribacillus sp. R9-11]|uniref:isopeptide-forming domain-containing fimbrial protein n=1 Tax=Peribacillus sp. R9-11 TaxID=3073271 RepID=UPI0028689132|nr:isopeptide-forming domain-containing fimbrial protein [Peribacillus sp. R9-11]WMX58517.1 isopeptide-forming domain-containing fimbrial protein [Peribacillus sp. R9-11]